MRTCVLGAMLMCLIGPAHADDAWRYRDIHLGARMTKDQIMHALGADKYANNPTFDPWSNAKGCDKNPKQKVCEDSDFNKYGMAAIEYEEFQLGPYCEDEGPPNSFHCDNPVMSAVIPDWGVHGHGISEVWVSVREGVVENIEVKFDSVSADEFFEVAHRQLGGGWKVEHEAMVISNRKKTERCNSG